MAFYSDDSTLVASDPISSLQSSALPSNNYLWTSPDGQAFPGWHHQLVLHMLALNESWTQEPEHGFSIIRMWLRDFFPDYVVGEPVIRAIAGEYEKLDEGLKSAYRGMAPLFSSWPRQSQDVNAFAESMVGSDLRGDSTRGALIDPALFRKSNRTRTTEPKQLQTGHDTPKLVPYAFVPVPEVHSHRGSLADSQTAKVTDPFTKDATAPRESDKGSTSAKFQEVTSTSDLLSSGTLYPNANTTIPPSTPLKRTPTTLSPRTPKAHRIMSSPSEMDNMKSKQPSPTPRSNAQSKMSVREPSADDEVDINSENAKIYAPFYLKGLVDLGYQPGQPKKPVKDQSEFEDVEEPSESAEDPLDAVENTEVSVRKSLIPFKVDVQPLSVIQNGARKTNLPKPDPTKYVETSRNHWKIPLSEADKFVEHFDPAVDRIPDRIEGYFWYCDQCYDSKQDQSNIAIATDSVAPAGAVEATGPRKRRKVLKRSVSGPTKGKFSGKRSVEKHMHNVHRVSWKCDKLPEVERGSGTMVPSSLITIKANTDMQPSQFEQSKPHAAQSSLPQAQGQDFNDEDNDTTFAPDSARRKLFHEELAERTPEPRRGGGKQAAWEQTAREKRAARRLPDGTVNFADVKKTRVFDEDKEVDDKEAYKDLSPANSANKTFYPAVEPEPGVKKLKLDFNKLPSEGRKLRDRKKK